MKKTVRKAIMKYLLPLLAVLVLAGCWQPMNTSDKPDKKDTPPGPGNLGITVSLPAAASASRGMTVASVTVKSTRSGYPDVDVVLSPAGGGSYTGNIYLAPGLWLVMCAAKDSSGTVIYSGQKAVDTLNENDVSMALLTASGAIALTPSFYSATGGLQTEFVRVTATRSTFDTVQVEAVFQAGQQVYLTGLVAGDWTLNATGFEEDGTDYFANPPARTITVVTNELVSDTMTLAQTRVTPVIFTSASETLPIVGSVSYTLSCATNNARIRYSTDGGSNYQDHLVGETHTLSVIGSVSAYAYMQNATLSNSPVASRTWLYALPALVATPAAGSHEVPQLVSLSLASPVDGVTIRYTLDGSEPTAASTVYDGNPVYVSRSRTLRALASKTDYADVTLDQTYVISESPELGPLGTLTRTLPATISGHSAVAVNGRLYVLGGYRDGATAPSPAVSYSTIATDGSLGTWTTASSLNDARADASCAVSGSKLYVLGGRDASGVMSGIEYATINADGSLSAWTRASSSLPLGRYGMAAASAFGYLYAIGGRSDTSANTVTSRVDFAPIVADGSIGTWASAPALAASRFQSGACVSGSELYISGGVDGSGSYSTIVERYSIGAQGVLTKGADSTGAPQSYKGTSMIAGDYLYLVEGTDGSALRIAYTPIAADGSVGIWRQSEAYLGSSIADYAFAGTGKNLYLVGGTESGTARSTIRSASFYTPTLDSGSGLVIDPPASLTVSIAGTSEPFDYGSTAEVQAVTSSPVSSYRWFLAGEEVVGETASTFAPAVGLDAGYHQLSVVVEYAGQTWSEETTIAVRYPVANWVRITSPVDGASYGVIAELMIEAETNDDVAYSRVDFYNGTTLLGSDASSPFSYSWNSPAAGIHALSVKAYKTAGLVAVSGTVTISRFGVGDTGPAGGIVFYDKGSYSDGWRYLEAAPSDQSAGIVWWNGSDATTGATATAIGAGEANTTTIVSVQGAGSYAASLCADLSLGVYDDWFLPSKDELNAMYGQIGVIGGFASFYYWSSSETSSLSAWSQYFGNGYQASTTKGNGVRVRAIRAF